MAFSGTPFSSSSGRVSSGIHLTRDTLYIKGNSIYNISKKGNQSQEVLGASISVSSDVQRYSSANTSSPASFSCQRGWIRYVELYFNDAESVPASPACQKFLPLCASTCSVHRVQLQTAYL